MSGLPEFPPEFVVPTLKVVHLSLEVHGRVIIPNQVLGFYGLQISIQIFFFIRIISLCNTLLNIHYLPNFAVCEHAHYQWVQYFRNKQKFFIFVLLLWCFDTQVHWCTNNKDRALYTSTHRQHPLQGGEPHLLQRPLLRLLLICKITISYSLKLCLHVLYTYFNSYTCICQWFNHTLNLLMDNRMHINMIIYFTQIK